MKTLAPDMFPDGTHEVPLTFGEGGPTIGLAEVTFKDGQWSARLTMDALNLRKHLMVDFTYVAKHHPINGDSAAVIVSFSPGNPPLEESDEES